MTTGRITIADVNLLGYEDFIERFGNVVEHCSQAAGAVWGSRPFRDINDLHECLSTFLDSLPQNGQQAILRVHPDLAGRAARQGTLTANSATEQGSAGLTQLAEGGAALAGRKQPEVRRRARGRRDLGSCGRCFWDTTVYKDKFDFPFVVCVRMNKKEAIFSGIKERLENDETTELRTGLEEVKKICYLRLLDLIDPEDCASKV
ncbi:2-oxo-4-hydroxy-4-carboxy-5-ureidoimidazoline decarboxylase-like [Pollicipes pollicipes]|uniref:2-oxo-4-hydroxy-4-carboxy-5-ureidoimidazoline decarboxylase-like n=1 Tax=Pollicipes pollicipes TaxID=41117 RepID=UPI00188492AE|nr:2-oxo-4-hydroxy-4-carboxy-5-ureidoimidazoline decarboxylase-like [Pollicipes pollicipes]